MGFSISSTHLVFFLASMLVASTLAGLFITSTNSISNGITEKENALTRKMKTDIEIINDPNNVPNDPLVIYVKNIGSTSLNKTDVDVLVNGTLANSPDISLIDGNDNIWDPTEVIKIEMDIALPSGDNWVKVVAANQAEDTFSFSR